MCYLFFFRRKKKVKTSWWFQTFFYFHPEPWIRWTHFCRAYFSDGLVQPPTRSKCFQKMVFRKLGIRCLFDQVPIPSNRSSLLGSRNTKAFDQFSWLWPCWRGGKKTQIGQFGGQNFRIKNQGRGPAEASNYSEPYIFIRCIWQRHLFFCFCWAVHFVVVTVEDYLLHYVVVVLSDAVMLDRFWRALQSNYSYSREHQRAIWWSGWNAIRIVTQQYAYKICTI